MQTLTTPSAAMAGEPHPTPRAVSVRQGVIVVSVAAVIGVQLGVIASVVKPWQRAGEAVAVVTESPFEVPTGLAHLSVSPTPAQTRHEPVLVAIEADESAAPPVIEPVSVLGSTTLVAADLADASGLPVPVEADESAAPPAAELVPDAGSMTFVAVDLAGSSGSPIPVKAVETAHEELVVSARPRPRARPWRRHLSSRAASLDSPEGPWLTAQSKSNFTLQLISMVDSARFNTFAERVPGSAHMARLRIRKDGRVLNVLVRGVYTDRVEAEQAARTVGRIVGVKPWVRRIGDVRRDLAANA
jgi:septal ring-binding cell division protein DamX